MLKASRTRDLTRALSRFSQASPDLRAFWLDSIRSFLPSGVRAYNQDGALYVYCSAEARLPMALGFNASYIERTLSDGTVMVEKDLSGQGQRAIKATTEPKESTFFDALLEDLNI